MSLRKAKIVYNFGLSECNRANLLIHFFYQEKKTSKLLHLRSKVDNSLCFCAFPKGPLPLIIIFLVALIIL